MLCDVRLRARLEGEVPWPGLEISPTKIGFVIVKARECAAKVAAWDDGATSDHDAELILESFSRRRDPGGAQGIHPRPERGRAGEPRGARLDRQRLVRAGGTRRGARHRAHRAYQPHRGLSARHAAACPIISRKGSTGSVIRSRTPRTTCSKSRRQPHAQASRAPHWHAPLGQRPDRRTALDRSRTHNKREFFQIVLTASREAR